MKVIICKGLQGAGKTFWSKQFCIDNPDYVRVNRDDLRNMRGKYWLPKDEDMITDWEQFIIINALWNLKSVIVDATNFNTTFLERLKDRIIAEHPLVSFEEKFFDTPLEECILRDSKRENPVGETVIRNFHSKYFKK